MSMIGASPAFHLQNHYNVRNTDKLDFNLSTTIGAANNNTNNFTKKMDAAKLKRKQRNQVSFSQ